MTVPAGASIPYIAGESAGLDFTEVPSSCPIPELGAAARVDPYWAGVWASGSQAAWISEDQARRQIAAGIAALPRYLDVDRAAALSRLQDAEQLPKRVGALAALDTWRTMTAEQMAAITGDADIATGRSGGISDLFAAGVVDIGVLNNALFSTRATARASLYRPSRTHAFTQDVQPHLTYPEWVSITGGRPWESGSQFDRHNVLAAELALRVAEWSEIGAVVGEKLSTFDLLAHSGAGFPEAVGAKRAADATLVRTDGARIAVEMTATTGRDFESKVRRWAELLSKRRMSETGLCVVFVLAPKPDKTVREGEFMTRIKVQIAAAVRDFPGVSFDRTASRMFVADWRAWFPAAHRVSPQFLALEAQRPTGARDALWETAALLDPFDTPFEPVDESRALATLENLRALRSVPFWLRGAGPTTQLWSHAIRSLGYDKVPQPLPARPETYAGRRLGAGSGSAAATRPPARLSL